MKFSKKQIIEIVEQASTLTERLGIDFTVSQSPEDNLVDSRLERWCQLVAEGDWKKFEQRLKWDKLELKAVRNVLGNVSLIKDDSLPKWVSILEEITAYIDSLSPEILLKEEAAKKYSFLNPDYPLPFENLFIPFICVAKEKLVSQLGGNYPLLSQEAYANLEHSLLIRLTEICGATLELEFSVFRVFNQSLTERLLKLSQDSNSSQAQYEEFIKSLIEGRILSLFHKYPVLARLIATVIDFWVDACREFILHLASDWNEIQKTFSCETQLKQVVDVQPRLSDYHNNGRSVILIKFNSGLKLVYKPKDLGLEDAYFKLLSWLNQQDIPLTFNVLKIINHSTYGWVEFVEALTCKNIEETKRYYQRSGMILLILHLLGATDIHHENIIACGEFPVLVDLETLMHPEIDKKNTENVHELAYQQLYESVLRTGLLPYWYSLDPEADSAQDTSGLGAFGNQITSFRVVNWSDINTDKVKLFYEYIQTRSITNLPLKDFNKTSPINYVDDIINGFKLMAEFFIEKRDKLLEKNSILAVFSSQKVRFVFRPTSAYGAVLAKMLHPKYLKNGIEQSIQLDILSKAFIWMESKSIFWSVLKVEKKALEQLDVPIFIASSKSNNLNISCKEIIKGCFKSSSFSDIKIRLQHLSYDELEKNVEIIKSSFYARTLNYAHYSPLFPANDFQISEIVRPTSETMVEYAIAIGIGLQKRAICSNNGSVTWISPQYNYKISKYQISPMGVDLYEGYCGVALFLSALARITSIDEFRNLAIASLQPLYNQLQKDDCEHLLSLIKNEGIARLGGIIYSLVKISYFLHDPCFIEMAEKLVMLITPSSISTDQQFDVVLGVAGVILGLLTLYRASGNQKALDLAMLCGRHLLSNRVITNLGYKTWKTLNGKLLTGFSHGAAGIAYTLLCLYQFTGENALLEAANEAITYEKSVFNPDISNWPDLRFCSTDSRATYSSSWCHGAPGIGLARIAGLNILDTNEIRADIEAAINTTNQYNRLTELDDLCCGNMSRVECLFTAAQKLSQQQLQVAALNQTAKILARAKERGTFSFSSNWRSSPYLPGFFKGVSGIGYQLLRLAHPDLLPSVLIWE